MNRDDDGNSPILFAHCAGVARRKWLAIAIALHRNVGLGDANIDQHLRYCLGAAQGQLLVVCIGSHIVGMTFYAKVIDANAME